MSPPARKVGKKAKRIPSHPRLIIGWREFISIPEWDVSRIQAKADTGAKSSAIDVEHVERLPGDQVQFELVFGRKGKLRKRLIQSDIVRQSRIRSSNGAIQERFIVAARVKIGPITKRVEFSLVRRHRMTCRALLGRTALAEDFLVEPSSAFLLSPAPGRSKK